MNTTANTSATTRKPVVNNMVWLVDMSGELVNEKRDERRSSDGRFLKVNCKMEMPVKRHSPVNTALAAAYGVDADELFA